MLAAVLPGWLQIAVDTYEAPTPRSLSLTKLTPTEQAAYAGCLPASFNIETICVSVNRLRLMGTSWLDYRA